MKTITTFKTLAIAASLFIGFSANAQKMSTTKLTACNLTADWEIIEDKCVSQADNGTFNVDIRHDDVTYTNEKGGETKYRVNSKKKSGETMLYYVTNTTRGGDYVFTYDNSSAVMIDQENMLVLVFTFSGEGASHMNSGASNIMRNSALEGAKEKFGAPSKTDQLKSKKKDKKKK